MQATTTTGSSFYSNRAPVTRMAVTKVLETVRRYLNGCASPWKRGDPLRWSVGKFQGSFRSLPDPQLAEETRVETGLAPSQTAEQLWVVSVLGRAWLHRLRKNSMLHLILGGAALQRCNNWRILINGFWPLRAAAAVQPWRCRPQKLWMILRSHSP